MINNKSNLLIHKTTAGNVVFSDNSNPNKVYSIYPQETKIWIDKDSIRQSSRISIGDGRENFSRLQIVATKLNNDPAIPFNGITQTDTDLLDILGAFFIAPTSGTIGTGLATEAKQEMQLDEAIFQTNLQNSTLVLLPSIRTSGLATVAATEQMAANQTNGAQVSKDFLLAVDIGLMPNVSTVKKSGKNFDVDTATTPESIWNGGGLYTGFPTSGFGTLQAFSSSAADIGTLTITYLETSASTAYTTANIAINGTTPTNTAITAYRVHTAFFTSSANTSTQLNAGVITVRYTATPAVVFLAMPAGRNQSYMAGYTIPAGKKGLLFPTTWRANLVAGASVECAMYLRNFNSGVRMRRNVSITSGTPATDAYEGGILLDELTDIMPTVLTSSANNVTVEASYTIMIFNA